MSAFKGTPRARRDAAHWLRQERKALAPKLAVIRDLDPEVAHTTRVVAYAGLRGGARVRALINRNESVGRLGRAVSRSR